MIDLHHGDAFWVKLDVQHGRLDCLAGVRPGWEGCCGGGVAGVVPSGGAGFVVELALEGAGPRRAAVAEVGFGLSAQDREDVRWYLEDYLQYPVDAGAADRARVEARLAALGADLFRQVFEANRDTIRLWDAVAGSLPETRVEVDAGVEGAVGGAVGAAARSGHRRGAGAAGGRVRAHPSRGRGRRCGCRRRPGGLRVLLVICRPGGAVDVPFRSVASHLVRLSRGAREAFRLDVLRPPTFAAAGPGAGGGEGGRGAVSGGAFRRARHLAGRRDGGRRGRRAGGSAGSCSRWCRRRGRGRTGSWCSRTRLPREGSSWWTARRWAQLLADTGVPVLVLNACRSAHADLATEPEHGDAGSGMRTGGCGRMGRWPRR